MTVTPLEHDGGMSEFDDLDAVQGADLRLDCRTCVAVGTTACEDCVVTHLLANDDGPIDLVVVPDPVDAAVELLAGAGLISGAPSWVERSDFEPAPSRPVAVRAGGRR